MSELTAQLRGVDELQRRAAAAADDARAGFPAAQDRAAEAVADVARTTTAPRRTGHLADMTTAEHGTVVSAVDYARPVHARQPYVTEAVARAEGEIVTAYEDHAEQLLD